MSLISRLISLDVKEIKSNIKDMEKAVKDQLAAFANLMSMPP